MIAKPNRNLNSALTVLFVLASCLIAGVASAEQSLTKKPFGKTAEGVEVDLYTLTNSRGMQVSITNFGGIIVSLLAPDRNGKLDDVVLGFDKLDSYLVKNPYFGVVVGRYGNRIAKGRFTLDGKQYVLACNSGKHHAHGGVKGFDKVVWRARGYLSESGPSLVLHYQSKDGEEGYPGNLDVSITYLLTDKNELRIHYEAKTDAATPINLTNHSYFNLVGAGNGNILGHRLILNADRFTPVDKSLIPTGELAPVEGTPFDFRKPTAIGARVEEDNEQLSFGGGYDHNFVLAKPKGRMGPAARVYEPTTGRVMEVFTTEPGVQFYTGNFLDGSSVGKGGKAYQHRCGFCLETQHFPDSPNQPAFPSSILRPGQKYDTTTIYRFSTQ